MRSAPRFCSPFRSAREVCGQGGDGVQLLGGELDVSGRGVGAHAFIAQRYTRNLATLAGHLRKAVVAGDVASLANAEIEVRLITAALDGIGLQWLLDPSTDVAASVSTYVERAISTWRGR